MSCALKRYRSGKEHPVSCIEPGLATHFIYDIIHVSMPFSQIIPPSPSPTSCCFVHTQQSSEAPNILYHASNLDWRFISYMILYMFQCHSPKSSHPLPLPQSPKDCSIHLCLFCCLTYRVIVTIFLNSIYMR